MKADWGSANTPDNPCAKGGANGVDPGWYELVKHPSSMLARNTAAASGSRSQYVTGEHQGNA